MLHRRAKTGLGAAYVAGFRAALDQGCDTLVEMDADGSHRPEELPKLLTAFAGADIALGSQWVPGGETVNWLKSREHPAAGHDRRLPRLPRRRPAEKMSKA